MLRTTLAVALAASALTLAGCGSTGGHTAVDDASRPGAASCTCDHTAVTTNCCEEGAAESEGCCEAKDTPSCRD